MIKKFNEFVNEQLTVAISDKEYGYMLFDEISESLVNEIQLLVNEGKISFDENDILEEGKLFKSIAGLFKKGVDASADKIDDLKSDSDRLRKYNFARAMHLSGGDIKEIGSQIKKDDIAADKLEKINKFLEDAEKLCLELSDKEDEVYNTITKKFNEANDAIKEFVDKSINFIKDLIEKSENKIEDILTSFSLFLSKMGEIVTKTLKKVGKGLVIGVCIPLLLTYSLFKAIYSLCKTICEKSKEVWNDVKKTLISIKDTIVKWVADTLNNIKDALKKASDNIKDTADGIYKKIAKAYLFVCGICGQLVSDANDKIKEAYNDFINSANDFKDDVKEYISKKWDAVTNWCKNAETKFKEGVKSVFDKIKDGVNDAIKATKGTADFLKQNAKSTFDDLKSWNDERQIKTIKATLAWSVEKWGKDEVQSWLDNI